MGILLLVVAVIVIVFIVMINRLPTKKEETQGKPDIKNLLKDMNTHIKLLEVLRQARLVGDKETENAVLDMEYTGVLPEEVGGRLTSVYPDKLLILGIAGINYAGDLENYVGKFEGVLVPEPENEFDTDAIKVLCADRKHLGYISKESTSQVREFIGKDGTEWKHIITGVIKKGQDDEECDRTFYSGTIYIVR